MQRFFRPVALATAAGVLYFTSWIGFGIWPLAFVCFVPLLWALRDRTPRQALAIGCWMGFVTHLGGYTWIVHLLRVFGYLPLPLAWLGYLLLCAAQGALFGVFSLILRWSWARFHWPMVALAPLALCATEFGFPLLFQSYTGVAMLPLKPIIQIADLGGPLLLTALQAAINGAIFDFLEASKSSRQRRRWASPAYALLLVIFSGVYGVWRMRRVEAQERVATHRRIGVSQPNVGEAELHEKPELSVEILWKQTAELYRQGAELVAWPEAAFNIHPVRLSESWMGKIMQHGIGVSIIAGIIRQDGRKIWNSAILVTRDGRLGDYFDKINLLAFGEYIPFGDWFPIVYKWSPMSAPMTRGETTAPLSDGQWRFATFICYEDILPALVRKTMADHGRGRAHAMVNLTNDSWYGAGFEQEQHLQLAALRSVEHHRWLIRATSTGISAFVDGTGRVVRRIERNQRGTSLAEVPMLEGETAYEILGDWPGWLAWGVLLANAARVLIRRRKPPSAAS